MTSERGWMEIDCPLCGLDYDVELDAVACPCGHDLTADTLAAANRYDAEGRLLPK